MLFIAIAPLIPAVKIKSFPLTVLSSLLFSCFAFLFGKLFLQTFQFLKSKTVAVDITDKGIQNNACSELKTLIIWKDITKIDFVLVHREPIILINVIDKEKYYKLVKGKLKFKLLKRFDKKVGSPIYIPVKVLDKKGDEVFNILTKSWESKKLTITQA